MIWAFKGSPEADTELRSSCAAIKGTTERKHGGLGGDLVCPCWCSCHFMKTCLSCGDKPRQVAASCVCSWRNQHSGCLVWLSDYNSTSSGNGMIDSGIDYTYPILALV